MANQNTSSLISQIYKSRGVLLELMKKQDYDVSEYDGFSINEINTMKTNNQLDMILSKKTEESTENNEEKGEEFNSSKENNQKKIYIKYYLGKSLRPNNLQEMIDDLFNVEEVLTKEDTLLIVVKDEVNETLTNALMHIWESEKIFIIIMPLQRLQFNILEHVLVPPHRILNEIEKINVKNRYNIISDEQFPQLSRFDPVAKAIGIRPGQVCEITRPSKTAISALYYRICT
jgi:DNA-directed RNA polymerase subunit H (RpoH/RPB5)